MNTKTQNRQVAFTLVETMIAVSISVIAMTGALSFYINTTLGHYIVDQRVAQASTLRRFSQELIYHAGRANQIYLYKSAVEADRDEPADQLHIDAVSADPEILRPAGDFVVFVYYETPKPVALDYHRIQKIVGYYLDADAGEIGPIRKITIDLSKNVVTGAATLNDQVAAYDTSTSTTMVEKAMKDNWASATHRRFDRFVLNARGLFETELEVEDVGRLFYYRDEHRSMMVAGQVYGTPLTGQKWTYTDSFNFSVTPRS